MVHTRPIHAPLDAGLQTKRFQRIRVTWYPSAHSEYKIGFIAARRMPRARWTVCHQALWPGSVILHKRNDLQRSTNNVIQDVPEITSQTHSGDS